MNTRRKTTGYIYLRTEAARRAEERASLRASLARVTKRRERKSAKRQPAKATPMPEAKTAKRRPTKAIPMREALARAQKRIASRPPPPADPNVTVSVLSTWGRGRPTLPRPPRDMAADLLAEDSTGRALAELLDAAGGVVELSDDELREALTSHHTQRPGYLPEPLPDSAAALVGRIKRLVPALQTLGVTVERGNGRWRITQAEQKA